MARAPKLLKILVHPDLYDTPEIQDLINKGHEVTMVEVFPAYDLILAPNAWRIIPSLTRMVSEAVKAARAVRYPSKKATAAAVAEVG